MRAKKPAPTPSESSTDYHLESIAEKRAGPGILLLSSSMQLMYRDRRTWELCAQINKAQNGKAANGPRLTDAVRHELSSRRNQQGLREHLLA